MSEMLRAQRGQRLREAMAQAGLDLLLVAEGVEDEAVLQLLQDQPSAVGLALPGMPGDSPGMGGDATTWADLPVLIVGTDGSLNAFDY